MILTRKLAATLASVPAGSAAGSAGGVPAGFSLRREGGATILGRDTCVTAEKLWLWREMEWPEIKAETPPSEQEWRTLAWLAVTCGAAGVAGVAASHFLPQAPLVAKALFLVGVIAGGWDAAVDAWENLRKREIDIHFLMLAVAIGAMFIDAWGEAVLLLFLFSASGAMEEYALDRTQREVGALLKTSPKRATRLRADGSEEEVAVESLAVGDHLRRSEEHTSELQSH